MSTDQVLSQLLDGLAIATRQAPDTEKAPGSSDDADKDLNAGQVLTIAKRHPHREIVYAYPIKDLVPPEAELILLEPINLAYRERPQKSGFRLGQHNLDYWLTVDPNATTLPLAAKHRTVHRVVELMDQINQRAGRTFLSAASFTLDGVFCCRISLQAYLANGDEFAEEMIDLDTRGRRAARHQRSEESLRRQWGDG
ncbi:hypothetical protein LTR65_010563 [Meristemomyces frigidus]